MKVSITYLGGDNNILVGYGAPPCTPIRIMHPWGFVETVRAGSKEEHGPGGFEVLSVPGDYRVDMLRTIYQFEAKAGMTHLEFYEGEEPSPSPTPEPEPEPEPEPDDNWDRLFAKLDRIEELLRNEQATVADSGCDDCVGDCDCASGGM